MMKHVKKYIHEGEYVAVVDVEYVEDADSWSPCLSVADAMKLDAVRAALEKGDVAEAGKLGKVYTLQPVRPGMPKAAG